MVAATGLKRRLAETIREKYGEVTTQTLRVVAEQARVDYTTLARFLLYSAKRGTGTPRRRTIASLALALDCSAEWLASGVGAQQRDIFPFALPADHAEPASANPVDLLNTILDSLRELPLSVQTSACRDAAAAVMAATTHNQRMLSAKAYLALMQLDALQVTGALKAAG